MPEGFDKCRSGGGRIRTISGPNKKMGLRSGEYVHVCINDSGMHRGYVKKKNAAKAVGEAQRRARG